METQKHDSPLLRKRITDETLPFILRRSLHEFNLVANGFLPPRNPPTNHEERKNYESLRHARLIEDSTYARLNMELEEETEMRERNYGLHN